jgi:hypothetical protein
MSMDIMEVAKHEYAETGTLATDTYMALNNAGLNADIVLAQLAGEIEDGEV